MDIQRFWGHLLYNDWRLRRAFTPESLRAIEESIQTNQQLHGGDIRFVVEGSLDLERLIKGQSPRERAIEIFAQLRIWDTEHNNGVLIYVLLADRALEILSDRGFHARVGKANWAAICHDMQMAFSTSAFESGALNGIAAVASTIGKHFPAEESHSDERPDVPVC